MGKKQLRMTPQTLRVLEAVSRCEDACGANLSRETGLPSGTLYPILLRLEAAGLVSSEWEVGDPAALGRPRRRFYRITAAGAREGQRFAAEMAPLLGRFAPC